MKKRALKIALDGLVYGSALILAFWLRFDGRPPALEFQEMTMWLPIVVAVCLISNAAFGIYRRIWRYVSIIDCVALALSTGVMTAIFVVCRMFLTPQHQIFRVALGVIATDYVLAVCGTAGLRIATRIYYEFREGRHVIVSKEEADARVLLVGAGTVGISVANEIRSSSRLRWNVIG